MEHSESDCEGPLLVAAGTPGNHRFGALLKNLRERSGLTPQQLADQADVHVSFVRGIERGAQAPSIATARPLLECVQGRDGIRWMDDGPFDLMIREPETGREVAFEFKAKVKGQNRRPHVDGATQALMTLAEVLQDQQQRVDLTGVTQGLMILAEASNHLQRRVDLTGVTQGLMTLGEVVGQPVRREAETELPSAAQSYLVGEREHETDFPDEARLGRVVRMLATASEATLATVERLLHDGLQPHE